MPLQRCEGLEDAVRQAWTAAMGGDVVLLMSGRGDKDIFQVARHLGVEL